MGDCLAVVIDVGSGSCKVGFAGDDAPRSIFPSLLGMAKYKGSMVGVESNMTYVGDEAESKKGVLKLKYPIEHGVVTNWDDMEKIWEHAFINKLRVQYEDQPVLLTEIPLNSKEARERTTHMMFECFNFPAMLSVNQALLTLYSVGYSTGCVVQSGDGVTNTVPICEGHIGSNAIIGSLDIAGRDITDHLADLLRYRNHHFSTSAEMQSVRKMKEKLSFVALDFEQEMKWHNSAQDVHFALPDGNLVTLGDERFKCAEILFQPHLTGRRDKQGVHQLAIKSIQSSDCEDHKGLYRNIIVAGGATLTTGFVERLKKEMVAAAPEGTVVRVISPAERKHSAWEGGATLASLESFQHMCIQKAEYDEFGPNIVHRKCCYWRT